MGRRLTAWVLYQISTSSLKATGERKKKTLPLSHLSPAEMKDYKTEKKMAAKQKCSNHPVGTQLCTRHTFFLQSIQFHLVLTKKLRGVLYSLFQQQSVQRLKRATYSRSTQYNVHCHIHILHFSYHWTLQQCKHSSERWRPIKHTLRPCVTWFQSQSQVKGMKLRQFFFKKVKKID